ncbi:histidine kinase [Pseudomonas sp. HAR-UPW-AIA-41]|uniref:oxygenase MpaB family protein n=1 Tax=Pseudomonas sp. HAR-UPW-AIA-41 TaxID=1985301 RepID=UPI000BB3531E|nr:oxygenase MpaB family protein [Pseudomonas sp. HAR-UPW-AIA-41]PAV47985.1 histidine kinase [Pseudomonas sp. HAR-UPW-AIA-41]
MEALRRRIEAQVLSLSGLALGQIDYEHPIGDKGFFGPDSMPWEVHRDFTCMLVGGVAALLLQMLHPLALAGVWDHSNFRQDMLGRLRRTGQFVAGTTFGPSASVDWLLKRVRQIHQGVNGITTDGQPYAASDPALLTWVHVAEVSCFLASYRRYCNPHLSVAEQDRYYAEMARVAEGLGATNVPTSCLAVADYLTAMRPQLRCDERTVEVWQLLRDAPAPSRISVPIAHLFRLAGIDLLPDWARTQLHLQLGAWQRSLIRSGVHTLAPLLRWAVRDGAAQRARRRMGLPTRD